MIAIVTKEVWRHGGNAPFAPLLGSMLLPQAVLPDFILPKLFAWE
jgi:hypothetical protein